MGSPIVPASTIPDYILIFKLSEPMIHPSNPKWRAIRLHDVESIEYINKLFKQGWYLLEIDFDGLDLLLMSVPINTPKRTMYKKPEHFLGQRDDSSMVVIVLHKGKDRDRQRAVVTKRDESGYFQMGKDAPPEAEWRQMFSMSLEKDFRVSIYEKNEFEVK